MKILIISYAFPPFNAVGALRVGKMAKYLSRMGHDVRVLTAGNQVFSKTLPIELDEKNITRTSWININRVITFFLGGKQQIASKGYEDAKPLPTFLKKLGYFYRNYFNFPDAQIGWYPFAVRAGKKLLQRWQPDVIWSSSPPTTSLLIAKKLSRVSCIPWVADLRDLWADNHNSELYYSKMRRTWDEKLERRTLESASALITISEPLAEILKNKFKKKIAIVMNGYDTCDYPAEKQNTDNAAILNIVHTGMIYPKKEDFSPVFKAIALLNGTIKNISVSFYGRGSALIQKIARQYQIEKNIACYDAVPYFESLRLQTEADVLLLLIHNSEKEKGTMPVKFFEYMGAKKPILLIGYTPGVASHIVKTRHLGLAENDPILISNFLQKIFAQKISKDQAAFKPSNVADLSRQEQAKTLSSFLETLI